MQEIEVKFLNIEPKSLEKKLTKIGATKIGEYLQSWKTFDFPDWRLDKQGAWIRLRDEGDGKITLSFKKRLGIKSRMGEINDDGMEEIEIQVDDFNKTATLLESCGFIVKHLAEKKRIKWVKDDIKFDIDFYPALEPLLEIETVSWEKIESAIRLLDLKSEDKKIFSGNQAYALKGIVVAEMERITFKEGLVKRKSS